MDQKQALILCRALSPYDISCWIDIGRIRASDNYREKLREALQSVDSAVVLLGDNGLGKYQKKELLACLQINRAINNSEADGKLIRIIPITVGTSPQLSIKEFSLLHRDHRYASRIHFQYNNYSRSIVTDIARSILGHEPRPFGEIEISPIVIMCDAMAYYNTPAENRDSSLLYRGARLRIAQKIADQHSTELTPQAFEFMSQCKRPTGDTPSLPST